MKYKNLSFVEIFGNSVKIHKFCEFKNICGFAFNCVCLPCESPSFQQKNMEVENLPFRIFGSQLFLDTFTSKFKSISIEKIRQNFEYFWQHFIDF